MRLYPRARLPDFYRYSLPLAAAYPLFPKIGAVQLKISETRHPERAAKAYHRICYRPWLP
jgi:hypothetical protein